MILLGRTLACQHGVERMVGRKSKSAPSSISVPVKLLITSGGPTLMTSPAPSFYLSVPSTGIWGVFKTWALGCALKPYHCVKLLSCCDNTMAKGSLGVECAFYPTPEKLGQQVWGKLLSGGTAHSKQCLPMSIANQEKDSGRSTGLSEAFFPMILLQVPVGCVKLKLTRRHCASLSVRLINLSKMFCCTSITEACISH